MANYCRPSGATGRPLGPIVGRRARARPPDTIGRPGRRSGEAERAARAGLAAAHWRVCAAPLCARARPSSLPIVLAHGPGRARPTRVTNEVLIWSSRWPASIWPGRLYAWWARQAGRKRARRQRPESRLGSIRRAGLCRVGRRARRPFEAPMRPIVRPPAGLACWRGWTRRDSNYLGLWLARRRTSVLARARREEKIE